MLIPIVCLFDWMRKGRHGCVCLLSRRRLNAVGHWSTDRLNEGCSAPISWRERRLKFGTGIVAVPIDVWMKM